MSFQSKPLTAAEITYLEANRQSKSVTQMADHLKRGPCTIYAWMQDNGHTPFKAPRVPPHDHPMRKKNRGLERTLKSFKQNRGIQHHLYSQPLKK